MTHDPERFRDSVLQAIRSIKGVRPEAHLHLVYTPELHDPLYSASDERRDLALLRAPRHLNVVEAEPECLPRFITLDATRVAGYLLEQDSGLDDPLFESSIAQAHAETFLGARHDVHAGNDDRELATGAIGGWVVSRQTAAELAARVARFSDARLTDQADCAWVRWTQPDVFNALWPLLQPEPRDALLGDAVWFTIDAAGTVRHYAAEGRHGIHDAPTPVLASLNAQQAAAMRNVPLVRELHERWQALCLESGARLPANAERLLHERVWQAQALGLGAEAVAICVLTSVQLKPGATQDPRWHEAIANARRQGSSLLNGWARLPAQFWAEWALHE